MSGESDNSDEASEDRVVDEVASSFGRSYGRRAGDVSSRSSHLWLVSFADVMALMLTFFVLLFAMSAAEEEKWDSMVGGLQQNFAKLPNLSFGNSDLESLSLGKIKAKSALNVEYLEALFEAIGEGSEGLDKVVILRSDENIALSFPSDLLFFGGKNALKADIDRLLFPIARVLSRIRNRIEVVSYAGGEEGRKDALLRGVLFAGALESSGYDKEISVSAAVSGNPRANGIDILIMKDAGERKGILRFR